MDHRPESSPEQHSRESCIGGNENENQHGSQARPYSAPWDSYTESHLRKTPGAHPQSQQSSAQSLQMSTHLISRPEDSQHFVPLGQAGHTVQSPRPSSTATSSNLAVPPQSPMPQRTEATAVHGNRCETQAIAQRFDVDPFVAWLQQGMKLFPNFGSLLRPHPNSPEAMSAGQAAQPGQPSPKLLNRASAPQHAQYFEPERPQQQMLQADDGSSADETRRKQYLQRSMPQGYPREDDERRTYRPRCPDTSRSPATSYVHSNANVDGARSQTTESWISNRPETEGAQAAGGVEERRLDPPCHRTPEPPLAAGPETLKAPGSKLKHQLKKKRKLNLRDLHGCIKRSCTQSLSDLHEELVEMSELKILMDTWHQVPSRSREQSIVGFFQWYYREQESTILKLLDDCRGREDDSAAHRVFTRLMEDGMKTANLILHFREHKRHDIVDMLRNYHPQCPACDQLMNTSL